MIDCLVNSRIKNDGLLFVINDIQGGRKRPVKFRHFLRMPVFLYDELSERRIINPEDFFIEGAAFFECSEFFVTISFITYTHVEDLHVRILNYLVVKSIGANPVERGGHSKL